MKEIRKLSMMDLRGLCIKRNWYTHGDCEAYSKILKMAENCENVTTAVIVEIAEDIFSHSDKDYWKDCQSDPVGSICFEIARICYSFFESGNTILDKETADKILIEIERSRQNWEYEPAKHGNNPDIVFRICQAIVAKEAGYENRNDWSTPVYEKIQIEMVEKFGYRRG